MDAALTGELERGPEPTVWTRQILSWYSLAFSLVLTCPTTTQTTNDTFDSYLWLICAGTRLTGGMPLHAKRLGHGGGGCNAQGLGPDVQEHQRRP